MKIVKKLGVLAFAMLAPGAFAASLTGDPVPAEISVIEIEGKISFQNDRGAPLYTRDADPKGQSTCMDKCIEVWIPVYARRDAKELGGPWSIIARPDNSRQWAYKGQAIYNYGYGEREPPTAQDLKGWSVLKP